MSGEAYLEITQGNNYPPIRWEFLDEDGGPVDLSGSVFRLRVVWPRSGPTRLDYRSDLDDGRLVLDGPQGHLTWNYSVDDSRTIPLGDGVARYELERRVGETQHSVVKDKIIVTHGDNPDESDDQFSEFRCCGINPNDYGAIGTGEPSNMGPDTHGIQTALNLSANTGYPVVFPAGIYIIDGYKGDFDEWSATGLSTHGGLVMPPGSSIRGAGVDKTILRNGAAPWRSILRLRSGRVSVSDLTLDGDVNVKPPVALEGGIESPTGGSIRGEVVILEGAGHIEYFELLRLKIINSGHYGIGIQNVSVDGGLIEDIHFSNIGGDCIDGKDYTNGQYKRDIYVHNIYTSDGCGHHYIGKYYPDNGNDNQTVLDLCGGMNVHGVFIRGLDSYTGQLGHCGVRSRAQLDSNSRTGSKGCSASLIRIEGGKLPNEGSNSLKRIIGIEQGDDNFHVSNAVVKNCFIGARVLNPTPESVPLSGAWTDISIEDCTGAGVDPAYGFNISSAAQGIFARNVTIRRCERGARVGGTRHDLGMRISDSEILQLESSDAAFLNNNIEVSFDRQHVTPSIGDLDPAIAPLTAASQVSGASPLASSWGGEVNVLTKRNAYINLIAEADDNSWIPPDDIAGGIQLLGGDTSGAGIGVRAAIRAGVTTAGTSYAWKFFTGSSAGNDVEVFVMGASLNGSSLPFRIPQFAKADLPDPLDYIRCMVFLSDPVGNKHFIISDGSAWLYMDGTPV